MQQTKLQIGTRHLFINNLSYPSEHVLIGSTLTPFSMEIERKTDRQRVKMRERDRESGSKKEGERKRDCENEE